MSEVKISPARKAIKESVRRPCDSAERANAEYNLGMAYEGLHELASAWTHYYQALKLRPSEARRSTLVRLIGEGFDASEFENIWEVPGSASGGE